jgi:S1-C subfamily serine protease
MSKSSALVEELSTGLTSLVTSVANSIVAVRSGRSRSSGFVWRPGFVVTADEPLSDERELSVTLPQGNVVAAQLVGRDPSTDIALLGVENPELQPLSLTPTTVLSGTVVLAVGAEEGTPTASFGIVSRAVGPWRSMRGGEIDARIELDLRLRPSAEGGLVLNMERQAIGMSVFGPRRRVLVIPSSTIDRITSKLESHGRIPRGYLGLGIQPVVVDDDKKSAAMVVSVDPSGPGAVAGLYQGDILMTWNGERVQGLRPLLRALGPDSVGQTVRLGVRRSGKTQDVPLTIGERPSS